MAQGDWAASTTLRPTVVNITFDNTGKVDHVGIGYEVVLPSGAVARRAGYTHTFTAAEQLVLQKLMTGLLNAAISEEGVSGLA